ncbi:MAG: hypothetical protein J0I28_06945 [Caulobacterales bacterium]|nr:hypothetical protein [Caulobacterales bacterium]
MKTMHLGALAILGSGIATATLAASPPATPSYSAQFDLPVSALRNCYMSTYRSDALISATPTGYGFVIRRKGET